MDFKICATYGPHNRVEHFIINDTNLEVFMDMTGQNTTFGIDIT